MFWLSQSEPATGAGFSLALEETRADGLLARRPITIPIRNTHTLYLGSKRAHRY